MNNSQGYFATLKMNFQRNQLCISDKVTESGLSMEKSKWQELPDSYGTV